MAIFGIYVRFLECKGWEMQEKRNDSKIWFQIRPKDAFWYLCWVHSNWFWVWLFNMFESTTLLYQSFRLEYVIYIYIECNLMGVICVVNVNMTTRLPFPGLCFVLKQCQIFRAKHIGQPLRNSTVLHACLNELSSILLPHRKDVKQLQCILEGENRCIVKDIPPRTIVIGPPEMMTMSGLSLEL